MLLLLFLLIFCDFWIIILFMHDYVYVDLSSYTHKSITQLESNWKMVVHCKMYEFHNEQRQLNYKTAF